MLFQKNIYYRYSNTLYLVQHCSQKRNSTIMQLFMASSWREKHFLRHYKIMQFDWTSAKNISIKLIISSHHTCQEHNNATKNQLVNYINM